MPSRIAHAGQQGWAHDEGHRAGFFHTWDRLDVGSRFGPRKVHVFLPRSYRPDRGYPTVWMLDGNTAFWPGGVAHGTWDAAGVRSAVGEAVQELIIVAVHPVERDAEYTHADWYHGERPWGLLPAHTDYLADEVKAFVDDAYGTSRHPASTAIVGSSHGGLAAFWVATRRPETFGIAGCMSPSFFTGLDSLRYGSTTASLADAPLFRDVRGLLADRARRPRLWIDWGGRRDGGEHNSVVEALAALRGAEMIGLLEGLGYIRQDLAPGRAPRPGAELYAMVDPAAGHDERAWRMRLAIWMRAFFPAG